MFDNMLVSYSLTRVPQPKTQSLRCYSLSPRLWWVPLSSDSSAARSCDIFFPQSCPDSDIYVHLLPHACCQASGEARDTPPPPLLFLHCDNQTDANGHTKGSGLQPNKQNGQDDEVTVVFSGPSSRKLCQMRCRQIDAHNADLIHHKKLFFHYV